MARPSKLSDKQWAEVTRRNIAGEKAVDLAKEFKISPAAISRRVTQVAKSNKAVAHQLATAELAFQNLPVMQQAITRNLTDDLKAISSHLAGAAANGAITAHKLSVIAARRVDVLDTHDHGSEGFMQELKGINALTRTGNDASDTGIRLLQANKDMKDPGEVRPKRTIRDFYADTKPSS